VAPGYGRATPGSNGKCGGGEIDVFVPRPCCRIAPDATMTVGDVILLRKSRRYCNAALQDFADIRQIA
jgi:hypothetical protein